MRTIRGLAWSAVPGPTAWVTATLAIGGMLAVHVVARIAGHFEYPHAAKMVQIATTLEAMPLWILLANSMCQVAARIVQAWADTRAWLADLDIVGRIMASVFPAPRNHPSPQDLFGKSE